MLAYLGLGANLNNPVQQLQSAIAALKAHPEITNCQASSFYRSMPMGPQDQPDYVNAVVACHTKLPPLLLLDVCQSIEQAQHRVRGQHWGARTLDIDILAIDDLVMHCERLTLPHPGIALRDFVLLPWRELAPDAIIPYLGRVADVPIVGDYHAQRLEMLN